MPELCMECMPFVTIEREIYEEMFHGFDGDAMTIGAHQGVWFFDVKKMLIEANVS